MFLIWLCVLYIVNQHKDHKMGMVHVMVEISFWFDTRDKSFKGLTLCIRGSRGEGGGPDPHLLNSLSKMTENKPRTPSPPGKKILDMRMTLFDIIYGIKNNCGRLKQLMKVFQKVYQFIILKLFYSGLFACFEDIKLTTTKPLKFMISMKSDIHVHVHFMFFWLKVLFRIYLFIYINFY